MPKTRTRREAADVINSYSSSRRERLISANRTRLVQKPNWTRLRGKSETVYSGTRTFCLFDRGKSIKSVYRSTHFHFCP